MMDNDPTNMLAEIVSDLLDTLQKQKAIDQQTQENLNVAMGQFIDSADQATRSAEIQSLLLEAIVETLDAGDRSTVAASFQAKLQTMPYPRPLEGLAYIDRLVKILNSSSPGESG